jgi:hypothetical protein
MKIMYQNCKPTGPALAFIPSPKTGREFPLGTLKVNAVFFAEGKYTDLGTPEGISSFIFQGSR